MRRLQKRWGAALVGFAGLCCGIQAADGLFARSNLVAWCIVPFDAAKRGPEARAAMLERLGLGFLAYDYRSEHVPTFDAELDALARHRVRLLAWWFPTELNEEGRLILDVLKRHSVKAQLWVTGGGDPARSPAEQEARVRAEVERIRPIATAAAAQGCTVALYNHGGWFGEPENQVAVLRSLGLPQVGIVYNLHHGHDHVARFAELLRLMKPHLLAINLNGMTRDGDRRGMKILPLGQGELDLTLLRVIRDSGWVGPVGILNHTEEDAEGRLRDNLEGLEWLVPQLDGAPPPGPRPVPRTWRPPRPPADAGTGSLHGPSGTVTNDRSGEGLEVLDREALGRRLEEVRTRYGLPALSAAVVSSRGVRTLAAVGVRRWGGTTPVTDADLWHLGSNTKAMTAFLAGKLVEQGRLRWDSTVAEVFADMAPAFHPDWVGVTLLHLLTHRAGLQANLAWTDFAVHGSWVEQRREVVRRALSVKPAATPGAMFLYSNLGYVIVGAMIERRSGMAWEEAMRREVFMPLGMTNAGFGGFGTPGELDQPWGHERQGHPAACNGPEVDNPGVLGPAGRVHAPLQDWARFIAEVLRGARGEGRLLTPETYRTLFSAPFGGDCALGWMVVDREWGGGTVYNHCGCNTLFYANVWVAPRRDFAVLVCANQGLDASPATDAAVAAVVEEWGRAR